MSPARGDGDGHTVSGCFQAFVLWRLSLAVCCVSSESQSSSGRISASVSEQRDCRPFSTDVLATLTLLLLVLLYPAASRAVRPTPGISALTSRAGPSLSFLFLTPPAASRPACAPGAPGLSLDPVSTPEFRSSVRCLVARAPSSRSLCCLKGAGPWSTRSPMQVATASRPPNEAVPSPFRLSSHICARFHGSPLPTAILSTGDVHL